MSLNGHIEFSCSQCAQPIRVRSEYAGKRCRCKNCAHEMTIPAAHSSESELGQSASGAGEQFLNKKRSFHGIPRCPQCDARLVLIGVMKKEPMLRCGRCGAEFMNQFFGESDPDDSADSAAGGISDELRESWKGVFGGLKK